MSQFTGLSALQEGYQAVVLGASGGIGGAIAAHLAADPRCGKLIALSRSGTGLDLTREETVAAAAEAVKAQAGEIDLLFCATGALTLDGTGPEKTIRAITPEAMAAQFALNALGPALVLKHFAPLFARNRRVIAGFLSAKVGSIGDNRLGGWISYRASKAALNQILRTAAIEIARTRPEAVVAALHPGTVATSLSAAYSVNHERLEPTDSAARLLSVLDGMTPAETGSFHGYDGKVIEW
ncbi:SDR family NAD(P)-dependent oxidoreductase [Rhizobium paknamense]|uniref:NAD(P)-dependent dehydrogenase (Short-subunit alcohol dehydrogenase family) n=1 Tax=Rhizobium paknamense TaxID=1206817 RepID=A0ABU0IBC5_9HYPH|nr:SDR family NAD(P)-dependent oxidoreductase [Rhizobium paknamense]MDQ0455501.1 NAD(P)-dependent dehydrogenase (short-subunit alcohol dehydrogenase family) [Rhizobium paknamense]